MPQIRTDDGPRKLRAVWLGPKGATLPFEWTYVQWIVTILVTQVALVLCAAVAWLLGAPVWAIIAAGINGSIGGVLLAIKTTRNITFDEPLRHKTDTARSELSRRRRRRVQEPIAWTWPDLPITTSPREDLPR